MSEPKHAAVDVVREIAVSRKVDGMRSVSIAYSTGVRDVFQTPSVPLQLMDLVGVQGSVVRGIVAELTKADGTEGSK